MNTEQPYYKEVGHGEGDRLGIGRSARGTEGAGVPGAEQTEPAARRENENWPPGIRIWSPPLESMPEDVMFPLAWEEMMCRRVGEGEAPIMHIWRHPYALTIGMRDRRLPQAPQAMEKLRGEGCSVAVRVSGGAAVPLDEGVVNVSLILPNPGRKLELHGDFERMVSLIAGAASPWTSGAQAGEIEGAFCPGDYDVSVNGRKFCGIAQRRQTKAYILTAFVIVEGGGEERRRLAREFYDAASGELAPGGAYPEVREGTMASLDELAGVPSSEAFISSLEDWMIERAGASLLDDGPELPLDELDRLSAQLKERYDRN
ncbi:lipoate--protein ligase family protein [Saccharibacillus sp. CPCC 101409]|uniref:lipoate--protein ligase family protein n=1 Tax=Saccharibacillus sp. CPCC 101409 TaxID=3058041 RepID=UPI0026731DB1|nr:lipoate--protein ligase family protein [Saccharibacillus sp. CPCC 101409]MDO3412653.1 lipoate--protein ligase family protein [Saccharibacillus sp. CPCC 101409]